MRKLSSFGTIATLTVFHRFKSPVYSSTKASLFSCLCPFVTTFMNGNSYGCIKTNNKLQSICGQLQNLRSQFPRLHVCSLQYIVSFSITYVDNLSTYSCIKKSTDCKAFRTIAVFQQLKPVLFHIYA